MTLPVVARLSDFVLKGKDPTEADIERLIDIVKRKTTVGIVLGGSNRDRGGD